MAARKTTSAKAQDIAAANAAAIENTEQAAEQPQAGQQGGKVSEKDTAKAAGVGVEAIQTYYSLVLKRTVNRGEQLNATKERAALLISEKLVKPVE